MHNDIIIIEGKVLILFSAIGLCFSCTYYLLKQAEMVKISSQVNSAGNTMRLKNRCEREN